MRQLQEAVPESVRLHRRRGHDHPLRLLRELHHGHQPDGDGESRGKNCSAARDGSEEEGREIGEGCIRDVPDPAARRG